MMAAAAICVAGPGVGWPQADLAKQLSNPVASLISVPLQFNYDKGIGPDDTACSVGSSRGRAGMAEPLVGGGRMITALLLISVFLTGQVAFA